MPAPQRYCGREAPPPQLPINARPARPEVRVGRDSLATTTMDSVFTFSGGRLPIDAW
jgi:hypothetical protein